MRRRTHRKSKNGCSQCKRRHIKCDERRPACVNCVTADFKCPFEDGSTVSPDSGIHQASPSNTLPIPSPGHEIETCTGQTVSATNTALEAGDINVLQLELFYQFISETARCFYTEDEHHVLFPHVIVLSAMEHQYLMYELFAFSASHLSEKRPDRMSYYLQVAASYRVKALSGLNKVLRHVDASNCKSVLFFSHLIGLHSFRDAFALVSNDTPFSSFLHGFIESMNLLRGVNTVISPWWTTLIESDIGGVILSGHKRREAAAQRGGSETDVLKELILSADLGETTRTIYLEAIKELQIDFNQLTGHNETHLKSTHLVFTWLMTSSKEFLARLDEQRPEALVILAYYGVVLHQYRRAWPIQYSGRFLVTAISNQLGERWKSWLKWPQEQIKIDSTPLISTSLAVGPSR